MSANLEDLARRTVGVYHPPAPAPSNGHNAPIDPFAAVMEQGMVADAQQLRSAQARAQAARMQAEANRAQAEAEAEVIEAQNRRDAAAMERDQLLAQRRQMQQAPQGGGDGAMVNALITLVTETQKDTRTLMQQLTEKQNEELKAQLDSTREQLTVMLQRPPEDPVASIAKYMAVFKELQAIAPKSEVTANAGQSVREIIELEKARNQMEIDRLQFQAQYQVNANEKARIEGEVQSRQVRDWQFAKMLNDAVPQLTAALTARITNSPWNPNVQPPPLNGAGTTKAWICSATVSDPGQPPHMCGAENWDPPETTETECRTCHAKISLIPEELPPPPALAAPPPPAPALA